MRNTKKNAVVSALMSGKALMVYTKVNGETRKAIGTLNPAIIASRNSRITLDEIGKAIATNRYFDLEYNGWRRFSEDSEVRLVG